MQSSDNAASTEPVPAAPVPAPLVPVPDEVSRGEAEMLARVMAHAHGSFVTHFEKHYKLSREDAIAKARETVWTDEDKLRQLEEMPPDQMSWHAFNDAMEIDPERVLDRWDRMKAEARDELACGARGGEVVRQESPWERARYLAVRQGFIDEWRPCGGLEMSLIDQLAQTYTGWMATLRHYELLAQSEVRRIEDEVEKNRWYRPPKEYRGVMEDRALQTADRFQRMFLRSLRALRDLRRYSPHITIHNRGQVNIGEQQVNVQGA